MMPKHFGIAGAGLVGRVVALSLLQKWPDCHIELFEQDANGTPLTNLSAAGVTAAGMLAPFAELETAESSIFAAGCRSIELWPELLAQLNISHAFQQTGSIITAHPVDMAELERFITQLRAKVEIGDEIEELCPNLLAQLEPDLNHHPKAFHLKTEGQVNGQLFMQTSQTFLQSHPQVVWHSQKTVKTTRPGEIWLKKGEKINGFDWVFDCRGLGAKDQLLNLRGVRGEVFWLDAPDVQLTRPVRLMHPRYRIYIVPRHTAETPHRYVVGATEIESEDQSPMSVRSNLELLSAVYSVHPSFGEARIVQQLTNCRPALSDNLPRVRTETGKTLINGLYRHGYLLAPALVEQALQEIKLT